MIQVYACGYATRDKRDNQEGKVPDGTGRRFLSGGRRKCCRFWAFSLSLARRSRVRQCLCRRGKALICLKTPPVSAPCRRTCRDRLRRCFSCYAIGGPSVTARRPHPRPPCRWHRTICGRLRNIGGSNPRRAAVGNRRDRRDRGFRSAAPSAAQAGSPACHSHPRARCRPPALDRGCAKTSNRNGNKQFRYAM